MDLDQRIAALMQKMLRLKFYVVLSQPSPTPEKLKPLLAEHLEYMISLEKRGILFASGPLSCATISGCARADGERGSLRSPAQRSSRR